jgi:hypothetical protein
MKIFSNLKKLSSLNNKKVLFVFICFTLIASFLIKPLVASAQLTSDQQQFFEDLTKAGDSKVDTTQAQADYSKALAESESSSSLGSTLLALAKLPITLPLYLIGAIFALLAGVTGMFTKLAVYFLQWILSDSFMSVSYTNPDRNPIIKEGLNITQNFVNMLLVMVLVFIALSTILRLKEYESKKLLANFVIIALLVNFAPVICGLIVDASNITMKYFLKDSNNFGDSLLDYFGGIWSSISSLFSFEKATSIGAVSEVVIQMLVMIIVNFLAFFLYLTFAMIFVARYIAIWVLVILSPIAFACWVLPITKKFWSMWWQQFIQWCLIGVTCGFFLHLAQRFVDLQSKIINTGMMDRNATMGAKIMPLFIPIVFLAIALFVGLQTSAMGASTIINWGKKPKAKALTGIGRLAQEGLKTREIAHWASTKAESVPGARWFWPEKIRSYGQSRVGVEKAQGELKTYSSQDLMDRTAKGDLYGERATAAIVEVISRGDSQDIIKSFRKQLGVSEDVSDADFIKNNTKFQNTMKRPLEIAGNSGMLGSALLRKDPRLARLKALMPEPGKKAPTGDALKKAMYDNMAGMVKEVKTGNVASMEKEVFEDEQVVEEMLGRERNIWEAVGRDVKRGRETSQQSIDKVFTKWLREEKKILSKPPDADLGKHWKEFETHQRTLGRTGYFDALKDDRFTSLGWREGTWYEGRQATPPVTPGAAAAGAQPGPRTSQGPATIQTRPARASYGTSTTRTKTTPPRTSKGLGPKKNP